VLPPCRAPGNLRQRLQIYKPEALHERWHYHQGTARIQCTQLVLCHAAQDFDTEASLRRYAFNLRASITRHTSVSLLEAGNAALFHAISK